MKTWMMTLPLLCAAGLAMAQSGVEAAGATEPEPAAVQPAAETAPPPKMQKTRSRAHARSYAGRTLPKGDVRHCLDLKTQAGLIRCSETGKRP